MDNCDLVWVNTMRGRRVTQENQIFSRTRDIGWMQGLDIYVTFGEL